MAPFLYGRPRSRVRDPNPWPTAAELETDGLGIMAGDMGSQGRGMPDLEIRHADE